MKRALRVASSIVWIATWACGGSNTGGGGAPESTVAPPVGPGAPGSIPGVGGSQVAGAAAMQPNGVGLGTGGSAPAMTGSMTMNGGAGGPSGAGGVGGSGGAPAAGSAGAGGAPGSAGSAAPGQGPQPSSLPTHKQACPTFMTGQMMFLNTPVMVWAGPATAANGPMVFYFHGTTGSAQEAPAGLGQAALGDVTKNGGVIASFGTNTGCSAKCGSGQGTAIGNGVWYTGDFDVADEILACAIEQLHVDPRRVHAAGYSAGGIQSASMAALRSNYIASHAVYSGGALLTMPNPNPSNVPPVVCGHGAVGSDVAGIDMAKACQSFEDSVKRAGSLAIDCDDGGAHWSNQRFAIGPNIWQFFKDHPYGAKPDAYAGGLPGGWPSYCKIW